MMQYEMSERHACRLLELSRSTYRYRVRNPERDKDLRARLKELAARRMRFGYRRLLVLLRREGWERKLPEAAAYPGRSMMSVRYPTRTKGQ